jgi:hypothetical protein
MQICIRTRRNIFFQTVSNDSFLICLDFFVILLSPRYADTHMQKDFLSHAFLMQDGKGAGDAARSLLHVALASSEDECNCGDA